MAGKTQAEMQAIYEADVEIINEQAERKKAKIEADYKKIVDRHLAALEKKKIEYDVARQKRKNRNDWLRADALRAAAGGSAEKIAVINNKYDNMDEQAELMFDQDVNASIEADMRVLDPIEESYRRKAQAVEAWRAQQLASESSQLQRGTQRPRRR
jgi:hypothetical protein